MPIRKVLPGIEGVASAVGTVIGLLMAKQRDTEQRMYEDTLRQQMEGHQIRLLREEAQNRRELQFISDKSRMKEMLLEQRFKREMGIAERGLAERKMWEDVRLQEMELKIKAGEKGEEARKEALRELGIRISDMQTFLSGVGNTRAELTKSIANIRGYMAGGEMDKAEGVKKMKEILRQSLSAANLSPEELDTLQKGLDKIMDVDAIGVEVETIFGGVVTRATGELNNLISQRAALISGGGAAYPTQPGAPAGYPTQPGAPAALEDVIGGRGAVPVTPAGVGAPSDLTLKTLFNPERGVRNVLGVIEGAGENIGKTLNMPLSELVSGLSETPSEVMGAMEHLPDNLRALWDAIDPKVWLQKQKERKEYAALYHSLSPIQRAELLRGLSDSERARIAGMAGEYPEK